MAHKNNHIKVPLPVKGGISPSRVWLPDGDWVLMLDFLIEKFPNISEDILRSRMERGELVDSDGYQYRPDSPYRGGRHVFYYRELPTETAVPFEAEILYQDDNIVVTDKPHFLSVVPSGRFLRETLLVRLKQQLGIDDITPIHRIDRETAGIVMFCINPLHRGRYQTLFQQREVNKTYQAVGIYNPDISFPLTHRSRMEKGTEFFRMQEIVGEINTETYIDVVEVCGNRALYQLKPVSGKQHQLRVHLASLGCEIVNDPFYPELLPCKGDDYSNPLQLLAKSIEFVDPLSKKTQYFESKRQLDW